MRITDTFWTRIWGLDGEKGSWFAKIGEAKIQNLIDKVRTSLRTRNPTRDFDEGEGDKVRSGTMCCLATFYSFLSAKKIQRREVTLVGSYESLKNQTKSFKGPIFVKGTSSIRFDGQFSTPISTPSSSIMKETNPVPRVF